jgi:hypothetical protein
VSRLKYRTHLVIPDTQVTPLSRTDHFTWIGNYVAEKRPDVIVHLGDHADMPSLNSYAVGKAESEGTRYVDDIRAAKEAMVKLLRPIQRIKTYHPDMRLTLGNHEFRIEREAENNPKLIGKISLDDLGYREMGWRVHPFLEIAVIDGIEYVHYVITGSMGRPASSAAAMLRQRHRSCVMGHVQKVDIAIQPNTQQTAVMAGICYQERFRFLTPQGQDTKRGIWMFHEVHEGRFDLMAVSLDFLRRRYS